MRDTSLTKLLESQVIEADSVAQDVGEQRERNYRYYTLQPLGNEVRGRSHYISPDVFDSVESKKALMAETFLSGRQVVKFASGGSLSKDDADRAMSYVNRSLRQNHIEEVMRDGWHDAFLAKRMIAHVCWNDTRTRDIMISVDGMTEDQILQQIMGLQNVVDLNDENLERDPETGAFAGEIVVTQTDHRADIELVQPELYFRDANVPYIREAMYAGDMRTLSRAQLIMDRFDPEQVMGLRRDYRWHRFEEEYARKAHDRTQSATRQHQRDPLHEEVDVYRTYTWFTGADILEAADKPEEWAEALGISEEDESELQLWKIEWTTGEILRREDGTPAIERAQEIPYFEWTEYKISHAEYGMADSDVVAHTQKTQSALKRLVIDNQQQKNNPRYEARKGDVLNPRDIMNSRIGGVTWSKSGNAVKALESPDLSPLTIQVLGMMEADRERRSGMSDLAKGMNGDAINHQNAQDMIERLSDRGTRRPMRAARDFAQTWLIPVCQYIVLLAARHDHQTHDMEVRGKRVGYVPSQTFPHETCEMEAHSALTPDETMKYAQSLYFFDQTIIQRPQMKPLYGLKQQHAVFDEILDALGVTDSSPFLLAPESPEAQQRFQAIQKQNMQQAMAEQASQEFVKEMAKSAEGREWLRARVDAGELEIKAKDTMADNMRKDEELAHEKVVDFEKLAIDRREARRDA